MYNAITILNHTGLNFQGENVTEQREIIQIEYQGGFFVFFLSYTFSGVGTGRGTYF
jgi:hypothetical protein